MPAHFASISNSESTYIAELEAQLQETRQKLLETKLRLSDSLVEAVQSKQHVENLTANFEQLLTENRHLERNLEQLKNQEPAAGTDLGRAHDLNTLQTHEQVEASLLIQLDKMAAENQQLKQLIEHITQENSLSKDGIFKA